MLLMLILPLQAIAATERQLAHINGEALDHLVAHAEHVQHHHDDQGNVHEDDSVASASHQLDFDLQWNLHGTLLSVSWPALLDVRQPAPPFAGGVIPAPEYSPPLRPPHVPA